QDRAAGAAPEDQAGHRATEGREMSGALDPIQEDLPLDLTPSSAKPPAPRPLPPGGELAPSIVEQVLARLRAVPWARMRAKAAPVLRTGAEQLGSAAKLAVIRSSTVARVAVKRGTPYAVQLAKGTARISFIRALPLLIARTIHLFGFPAVVLHLPITWITWVQLWLGLSFASHMLPSYEEAGPVAEQARVGVVKADPISVFWVIPAQIVALLTRLGGILPAVVGVAACWWLA